ncbi:tol-pal system-associated acyl-CoA thioesterase [Aestuariivirga sp.]|uniref:tol-pal system-associated acyl-CoA thioesterase n=1 Tax=Aestuariivirga sp. TaxID=2650926 RepID=UPI0039E694F4
MTEGTISKGVHRLPLRVYYEDTDFSGNVYHANYLKFCERARSDFLRVAGIDQNAMFGAGDPIMFVVRRMLCDFLRPARFDDLLVIETRLGELAGARFELMQQVRRGDESLFSADVTVALIDGRGRPRRVPPEIAARIVSATS